jgi:hypothetical protein
MRPLTSFLVGIVVAIAIAGAAHAQTRPGMLTTQDYVEIQQLYARYVHAIDSGDAETYAALFTPDGSFNDNIGHDALVAFIRNRNGAGVRHINTSLVITPTAEGAAGAVYNMFLNVAANPPAITGASQYRDTLVRTPQGWRFKTRVNTREGAPAPAPPAAR